MPRSVIVTGGFGALGQAVAKVFAEQGDKVARVDYAKEAPSELAGALDVGGVDLTDQAATRIALDRVVKGHGGIDILVNIAGGFAWETMEDGEIATWSRMHTMNLMTAVTITKLALPALRKSSEARIVNIGAGAAVKADMGMGAYAASKAGIHKLTEALSEELAGSSITVNAILPSIIDTPTNRKDMPDADFSDWVQPDAIAEVILFLASPAARAINGGLIPVTRGG
jgi:NAD(P)-dependent dehydrogenase (short-subunit alcohol dehydrogenase family)